MDPEHLVIVIGAIASAITAIIAAIFAGLIAMKQIPTVNKKLGEQDEQIAHIKETTGATAATLQLDKASKEQNEAVRNAIGEQSK